MDGAGAGTEDLNFGLKISRQANTKITLSPVLRGYNPLRKGKVFVLFAKAKNLAYRLGWS